MSEVSVNISSQGDKLSLNNALPSLVPAMDWAPKRGKLTTVSNVRKRFQRTRYFHARQRTRGPHPVCGPFLHVLAPARSKWPVGCPIGLRIGEYKQRRRQQKAATAK